VSLSLLATIVASTRRAVAAREARTPVPAPGKGGARPRGSFRRSLTADGLPRVIAECKRRSPSKGVLRREYDPAAIAAAYEQAGAAAISVLTEPAFFDGALAHLEAVRAAVDIPVLRKDFIVSRYQVAEARAAGADAILLIVAALGDGELRDLLAAADDEGLDALIEVHGDEELARAVDAGAGIVGVNSRNLHTLGVDTNIFAQLAPRIPPGVTAVAESGIRDAATIATLQGLGYRAFLIGERFMTAGDPGAALKELL
jgi:indole-3-glycerol phosphate synthase